MFGHGKSLVKSFKLGINSCYIIEFVLTIECECILKRLSLIYSRQQMFACSCSIKNNSSYLFADEIKHLSRYNFEVIDLRTMLKM